MRSNAPGCLLDERHRAQPILIVGGTGRTGRRVAERLRAEGIFREAIIVDREPIDFGDFARRAAATGVWDV